MFACRVHFRFPGRQRHRVLAESRPISYPLDRSPVSWNPKVVITSPNPWESSFCVGIPKESLPVEIQRSHPNFFWQMRSIFKREKYKKVYCKNLKKRSDSKLNYKYNHPWLETVAAVNQIQVGLGWITIKICASSWQHQNGHLHNKPLTIAIFQIRSYKHGINWREGIMFWPKNEKKVKKYPWVTSV